MVWLALSRKAVIRPLDTNPLTHQVQPAWKPCTSSPLLRFGTFGRAPPYRTPRKATFQYPKTQPRWWELFLTIRRERQLSTFQKPWCKLWHRNGQLSLCYAPTLCNFVGKTFEIFHRFNWAEFGKMSRVCFNLGMLWRELNAQPKERKWLQWQRLQLPELCAEKRLQQENIPWIQFRELWIPLSKNCFTSWETTQQCLFSAKHHFAPSKKIVCFLFKNPDSDVCACSNCTLFHLSSMKNIVLKPKSWKRRIRLVKRETFSCFSSWLFNLPPRQMLRTYRILKTELGNEKSLLFIQRKYWRKWDTSSRVANERWVSNFLFVNRDQQFLCLQTWERLALQDSLSGPKKAEKEQFCSRVSAWCLWLWIENRFLPLVISAEVSWKSLNQNSCFGCCHFREWWNTRNQSEIGTFQFPRHCLGNAGNVLLQKTKN